MRDLFLGAFSILVFGGCVPTDPALVPLQTDIAHPHIVEYYIGNGLAAYELRCVADGVRASLEEQKPSPVQDARSKPVITRVIRNPSALEWERFWRVVDRLHIERWKRFYHPVDVGGLFVSDASDWSVRLATPARTLESSGSLAYPAKGHPERTALDPFFRGTESSSGKPVQIEPNSLDPLLEAFTELLGRPIEH